MKAGRRKGSYIPKEVREALMLYLETGNRAEVSRQMGISQMTLYRWGKRYNWKKRLKEFDKEWSNAIAEDVLRRMKNKLLFDNPL